MTCRDARAVRENRGGHPPTSYTLGCLEPVSKSSIACGVARAVRENRGGHPPTSYTLGCLEPVSKSDAGNVIEGPCTVASSTRVRLCPCPNVPAGDHPDVVDEGALRWRRSPRSRCRWSRGCARSTSVSPAWWRVCGYRTRAGRTGGCRRFVSTPRTRW